jgi:hypothetical protein
MCSRNASCGKFNAHAVTFLLRSCVQQAMRLGLWTRWIWFVGCAAWVVDAAASVHLHDVAHAKLALMVASVFLIAGLFYQAQKR